jgi:hypothetical protein
LTERVAGAAGSTAGAAALALAGVAGSALVLVLWPHGWWLGLACVTVGAAGVRTVARRDDSAAFRRVAWLATGIGVLAATVLALALLSLVFSGPWT